nr:protein FAR-RED IMPAIRED RESPONSE 1-like [Arachis hypogaea]
MYVMLDREKNNRMVSKLELKHTHPCSAKQAVHYTEYRELIIHAKCVIKNNDEASIWPNKTYLALANEVGGSSNLGYSEKDVGNYITSNLCCADKNADMKEMISYFMRMKDINPNFFYVVDVDEANKFKSVLWIDARCRASYEYYRDVVSFDIIYSTNFRLHLSLVSTIMTSPFYSDVFCWEMKKFVALSVSLSNGCSAWELPQRPVITCKSIFGAIRNVLLDTHHRWCIWHIMKKIPHKFRGYARYREIDARMHGTVWDARSVESFEKD